MAGLSGTTRVTELERVQELPEARKNRCSSHFGDSASKFFRGDLLMRCTTNIVLGPWHVLRVILQRQSAD